MESSVEPDQLGSPKQTGMDLSCFKTNGPRREKTCLRGVCEQHRRRPACPSMQSDQRLVIRFVESIKCKHATGEISIF